MMSSNSLREDNSLVHEEDEEENNLISRKTFIPLLKEKQNQEVKTGSNEEETDQEENDEEAVEEMIITEEEGVMIIIEEEVVMKTTEEEEDMSITEEEEEMKATEGKTSIMLKKEIKKLTKVNLNRKKIIKETIGENIEETIGVHKEDITNQTIIKTNTTIKKKKTDHEKMIIKIIKKRNPKGNEQNHIRLSKSQFNKNSQRLRQRRRSKITMVCLENL